MLSPELGLDFFGATLVTCGILRQVLQNLASVIAREQHTQVTLSLSEGLPSKSSEYRWEKLRSSSRTQLY